MVGTGKVQETETDSHDFEDGFTYIEDPDCGNGIGPGCFPAEKSRYSLASTLWDLYDTGSGTSEQEFVTYSFSDIFDTYRVAVDHTQIDQWQQPVGSEYRFAGFGFWWGIMTPPNALQDFIAVAVNNGFLEEEVRCWASQMVREDHGVGSCEGDDETPPSTTASLQGTIGNANWYVTPVTISTSCTDDASGCASTSIRRPDGSLATDTASLQVSVQGTSAVGYYSKDVARNVETEQTTPWFKIDTVAPQTTSSLSAGTPVDSWYPGNVHLTVSCTDSTSGCTFPTIQDAYGNVYNDRYTVILAHEGSEYIRYHGNDNAGNVESWNGRWINIDKTAPIPSINTESNSRTDNRVNVYYGGADPYSGYDCSYTQWKRVGTSTWNTLLGGCTSGTAWFTGTPGYDYQFRSQAKDRVGHTSGWVTSNTAHINVAPIADAGSGYTNVRVAEPYNFDGGGSSDSDSSISQYCWDFDDVQAGKKVSAQCTSNEVIQYTYNTAGSKTVKLTVTDSHGKTDTDTVYFSVLAAQVN